MEKTERQELRRLVSDLVRSAGCSCCRDDHGWEEAQEKIAKILKVPKFDDGSGYDFYKFASPRM
jgi:hypothetical protein